MFNSKNTFSGEIFIFFMYGNPKCRLWTSLEVEISPGKIFVKASMEESGPSIIFLTWAWGGKKVIHFIKLK